MSWADDKSVSRLKSRDNGLPMSRRIYLLQGALAAGALVWTVFLLPRTSFVWWIGGNAIYSLLALVAAVRYRGRYDKVRSLAITELLFLQVPTELLGCWRAPQVEHAP